MVLSVTNAATKTWSARLLTAGRKGMVPPDRLQQAIARQIQAVRSSASDDVGKVRTAAGVVPELIVELGLGEFIGALRIDYKPRLLLRFAVDAAGPSADLGHEVVLKVYPDRPRGEGYLLAAWRDRGVVVPKVRFGERSGCTWLLLEYVHLSQIALASREECLDLTDELAAHGCAMHTPLPRLKPVLRGLHSVMQPRWDAAAEALRRAGHEIPTRWRSRAAGAYSGGMHRPLHGDLGLPNIGRDLAQRLVVIDASALLGDRIFDAARWAARLGGHDVSPEDVFFHWLNREGLPYDRTASAMLGVECVFEAGAREIVAARQPSRTPYSVPPGDRTASYLLDIARRLFLAQK